MKNVSEGVEERKDENGSRVQEERESVRKLGQRGRREVWRERMKNQ